MNKEEFIELKKKYSAKQIAKLLGKSIDIVYYYNEQFGLPKFTKHKLRFDDDEFKRLYDKWTVNEIAKRLHCCPETIRNYAKRLGLGKYRERRTDISRSDFYELMTKFTAKEIARELNVGLQTVYYLRSKLMIDLQFKSEKRAMNQQDKQKLREMWGNYSVMYIAQELAFDRSTITRVAKQMKLPNDIYIQ